MNALSIFAGACLLFACAMVGLWIKKRLIARAVFYEDYYEYLLFAGEKIGYERMPIHELNTSFANRKKGTFAEYLLHRSIPAQMSSVEMTEIEEYLSEIGSTDADTQIASLHAKSAEIKRFIEKDCVKYRKDASLYFKLSVLIGVAIFIILV